MNAFFYLMENNIEHQSEDNEDNEGVQQFLKLIETFSQQDIEKIQKKLDKKYNNSNNKIHNIANYKINYIKEKINSVENNFLDHIHCQSKHGRK